MAWRFRATGLIVCALGCTLEPQIHAQALPTATQRLHVSAFAGLTGTYTGLDAGRNLGITAGVDLGAGSYFSLRPSFEARGTYAVDTGKVDSQKNILGGLKVGKEYNRLELYGDVLFGRGQINYNNGFPDPQRDYLYFQSYSNILSLGGGVDVPLSEHLRFKVDGQFQRYSSPVTESGHLYAKPLTVGVVYRFASSRIFTR